MRLRKSLLVEDEEGHEVLITPADVLSEIQDAGPIEGYTAMDAHGRKSIISWRVSFRFTPKHQLWTEIVTCDAIKLLKALAGEE